MFAVFLGGPGSGKGTQAETLSRKLGIPHVSAGDLFRQQIYEKTPLGIEVEKYVLAGNLVPDSLTISILQERLSLPDIKSGVILDGFPRTIEQADALHEILRSLGYRLDVVLYIDVPDEVIVDRLSGRLICRECQAPFHRKYNPFVTCPKNKCHGEFLYVRPDDEPATVRDRLKTYHEQTAPLIEYYRKQGLLRTIPGAGSVEETAAKINEIL